MSEDHAGLFLSKLFPFYLASIVVEAAQSVAFKTLLCLDVSTIKLKEEFIIFLCPCFADRLSLVVAEILISISDHVVF